MSNGRLWQQAFGLALIVLLLDGCVAASALGQIGLPAMGSLGSEPGVAQDDPGLN
jgi:hypothetical protein